MTEKLLKLYNTLGCIETKGENTKTMALCLGYLEQLIVEEQNKEAECLKEQNKTEQEPVESEEE